MGFPILFQRKDRPGEYSYSMVIRLSNKVYITYNVMLVSGVKHTNSIFIHVMK